MVSGGCFKKGFQAGIHSYTIVVFDTPGPDNTADIVNIVAEEAYRCEYIVVASITGASVLQIADRSPGKLIICVTCPQGMYWEVDQMNTDLFASNLGFRSIRDEWRREGKIRIPMEITPETRKKLDSLGIQVVKGPIPFFGPSFSIRLHLRRVTSLDIVAKTFELISPGTLVCLECVLMATDPGIIPGDTGEVKGFLFTLNRMR